MSVPHRTVNRRAFLRVAAQLLAVSITPSLFVTHVQITQAQIQVNTYGQGTYGRGIYSS